MRFVEAMGAQLFIECVSKPGLLMAADMACSGSSLPSSLRGTHQLPQR